MNACHLHVVAMLNHASTSKALTNARHVIRDTLWIEGRRNVLVCNKTCSYEQATYTLTICPCRCNIPTQRTKAKKSVK